MSAHHENAPVSSNLRKDEDGDLMLERRPRTAHHGVAAPAAASPGSKSGELSDGEPLEDELVLSEVHLECCAPGIHPGSGSGDGSGIRGGGSLGGGTGSSSIVSTFCTAKGEEIVSVEHRLATPLRSVGMQVWRGSLFLADYLLHQQQQLQQQGGGLQDGQQGSDAGDGSSGSGSSALTGIVALELGAGPGLAGLVLSAAAGRVFLTDYDPAVLGNCQRNAERHLQWHPPPQQAASHGCGSGQGSSSKVIVRRLDWLDPPDWLLPPVAAQPGQQQQEHQQQQQEQPPPPPPQQQQQQEEEQQQRHISADSFGWQPQDVRELQQVGLLLAADPVYEDNLTECFMRSAMLLMQYAARHSGRSPRLLVGLERRVVFTMTDLEAPRAPAYDFWRTLFEPAPEAAAPREPAAATAGDQLAAAGGQGEAGAALMQGGAAAGSSSAGGRGLGPAAVAPRPAPAFPMVGRRLDISAIPQTLHPYQRSEYLELWELVLKDL